MQLHAHGASAQALLQKSLSGIQCLHASAYLKSTRHTYDTTRRKSTLAHSSNTSHQPWPRPVLPYEQRSTAAVQGAHRTRRDHAQAPSEAVAKHGAYPVQDLLAPAAARGLDRIPAKLVLPRDAAVLQPQHGRARARLLQRNRDLRAQPGMQRVRARSLAGSARRASAVGLSGGACAHACA